MKNYYNILKIDKNATSDEIKIIITKKIEKIKKSHITSEKKKLQLNELEEAYKFLNDYHKRKSLDEYVENNMIDYTNTNISTNTNSVWDQFNKSMQIFDNIDNLFNGFNSSGLFDVNNSNNSFQQNSSFISTKIDENGNVVKEEKNSTNQNGKIEGSHKITTVDKDGNEIIKTLPFNINSKKVIKYSL